MSTSTRLEQPTNTSSQALVTGKKSKEKFFDVIAALEEGIMSEHRDMSNNFDLGLTELESESLRCKGISI